MATVTVITINYYSQELIRDMEDLLSDVDGYDLVVVDNGGEYEAKYSDTKVVRAGGNIGFGRGCNLGAEHAETDILLFLNPDALLSASSLRAFIDAGPSDGSRAIWGPEIRDGNGRLPSLKTPGKFGLEFCRYYLDIPKLSADLEKVEATQPVLYISGACLAIGSELFEEIGGFCDDIFLYSEDLELCLRARDAGADVYLCKGVTVSHAGGKSSAKLSARFKRLGRSFRGHYVFMRKRQLPMVLAAINALHLASGVRV